MLGSVEEGIHTGKGGPRIFMPLLVLYPRAVEYKLTTNENVIVFGCFGRDKEIRLHASVFKTNPCVLINGYHSGVRAVIFELM